MLGLLALVVAVFAASRGSGGEAEVEADGAVDLPGEVSFEAPSTGRRSISYSLAGEYRSRARVRVDSLECLVREGGAPSGREVAIEAVDPRPVAREGAERTWFERFRFPVEAGRRYTVECRALPAALGNVPVRIGVGPTPEGGAAGLAGPWPVIAAGAALAGVVLVAAAGVLWRRRGTVPA